MAVILGILYGVCLGLASYFLDQETIAGNSHSSESNRIAGSHGGSPLNHQVFTF
jgi:hypothetical protein